MNKITKTQSGLPEIHLHDPVLAHARKDYAAFREQMTVAESLALIREHGLGERIIYFYVLDQDDRLVGVLPTRRLLSAAPETPLKRIMIDKIIAIPHTVNVLDACEWFVMHKLLAFPVVDEQRHLLGVADVSLYTQEIMDLSEREQSDAVFETLGVRIAQVKNASPFKAFRFRFPWLLATISGGIMCAVLTGFFEITLARSLILAFFLTLMLGLGESVSMQSMTVTVMTLYRLQPSGHWYWRSLRREITTALLLGSGSGLVVGLVVWLWWNQAGPAMVIALSIVLSLSMACILGLSIPTLLHRLRFDLKIAAGPLTLALTDLFTLLFYFGLATIIL